MKKQRRDFVKLTTVGAAGLVLARSSRVLAGWPASGTLAINPTISNMRVVACCDTSMVKGTPQMTFAAQNSAVDTAKVAANLDAMAMQLAKTDTADAAWKAIFRSGKDWDSTVVAIKVNTVEVKNMPRAAILQKLSAVLVGLGVSPSNIIIYDGGGGSGGMVSINTSEYDSYCSLTDNAKIQAKTGTLGNRVSTPIGGGGSGNCVGDLANGKVDILINLAVNKGHMLADTTLCMKNHFGTFDAVPGHDDITTYATNIHKSDAILGGTPPRQQLCIVDSLFAMKSGPTGTPDKMPGYLVMGVFAPAVDYLTVKKIREGVLKYTHAATKIDPLLTKFGYTTSDPEWVEVPPGSGTTPVKDAGAGGTGGGDPKGGSGGSSGTAGGKAEGSGGNVNGGSGGASRPNGSGGSSKGSGGRGTAGQGSTGSGGTKKGETGKAGSADRGESAGTSNVGKGENPAGQGGESSSESSNGQGGSGGKGAVRGSGKADANEEETGSENAPGGSGCHMTTGPSGSMELGVAAIVGAVVAGQLRRLFVRRDAIANGSRQSAVSSDIEGETNQETKDEPPPHRGSNGT